MWILIISLFLVIGLGALAGLWYNHKLRKQLERGEIDAMPEVKEVDSESCGQHEVCEKESLLAAVSKGIEYYDDEELDAYIGTAPEHYTPEEEVQFRDILYTMLEVVVAGCVSSLDLLGMSMTYAFKVLVYLIIFDRRCGD